MNGITAGLLRRHKALLKDRLQDTEFGILDKLLASDGLTHQEATAIQNSSTDPYVRSDRLIDKVLRKNIVPEFIQALMDTDQKHLVNYLRGDGVRNEKFDDDWPLTDDFIKRLNVNQGHLIDTIDPCHNDLVHRLLAAKVINPRQHSFISEELCTLKKNTALLNILRKRSVKDYNSTADCLNASNQKHVAEILQKGGVVIKLRFTQDGDPETVNRTEDAISTQILNLLRGLTIEERQRILEVTQLKVYAAKKGESIYLYVYCATLEELTDLHGLIVTGTVKTIVETLFNKFVSREDRIVMSLTYSEEEYNKCKLYFEGGLVIRDQLDTKEERIMEFIDCYRNEMMIHLPETDDDSLFNHHKLTVERVMTNIDKEVIEEAFMDIIDLNWKACEEVCRKTLGRVEKRIPSAEADAKSENYWSRMKRLYENYNSRIGEFLRSKMQFIRLEYLDDRQDTDFNILMEEIRMQATEAGANAAGESAVAAGTEGDVGGDSMSDATASTSAADVSDKDETSQTESLLNESKASKEYLEKELTLRMTWGRIIIFWNYWIDCRKETIDILNKILKIFEGEEMPADEKNPVQVFRERIISQSQGYFPLQFVHIVNKDFACYKVLLTKLTEFLDLVKSNEYLKAFGVAPKDLFFNISTLQTNISAIQSETYPSFEICENIIGQGLGETAKLLACTSRPLLHLKDLLRKLYDESRLNQAGIKGVVYDLKQEETKLSVMFIDSQLSFGEVSSEVKDAAEQLRKGMEEWLLKRDETIVKIKEIIEKLNKTTKGVAITHTVSASVGIVGGVIAIGGLILAPFTLGSTLIPSLIAGGVASGLGAATAIGASVAEIFIDEGEMEKAKACIEEDRVFFEEVEKLMQNLNQISTMLLRYIPQDELEKLITAMTNPQSTVMLSISSKSQANPRIAINIARLARIDSDGVVFSRAVVSGLLFASRTAALITTRGFFVHGAISYIIILVLAIVKLGKSGKSEHAEKLEEVVKKMENEKGIINDCLAE